MFGFAQVRRGQLPIGSVANLSSHYCGVCHALRKNFGLPYALLVGWDARFLALLVNAQQILPDPLMQTRCPATFGLGQKSAAMDSVGSQYAAAMSVFLMGAKLDDNVNDENSQVARGLRRVTWEAARRAEMDLKNLGFPLYELELLRAKQREIEIRGRGQDLHEALAPSARAMSLILSHTAELGDILDNKEPLARIGSRLGRLVALLDACIDYGKDEKNHTFNFVSATLPPEVQTNLIPIGHYSFIENYIYTLSNRIRSDVLALSLRRYRPIVRNILLMGFFDSARDGCNSLRDHVVQKGNIYSSGVEATDCPSCGSLIENRFCQVCGQNRYCQDDL